MSDICNDFAPARLRFELRLNEEVNRLATAVRKYDSATCARYERFFDRFSLSSLSGPCEIPCSARSRE